MSFHEETRDRARFTVNRRTLMAAGLVAGAGGLAIKTGGSVLAAPLTRQDATPGALAAAPNAQMQAVLDELAGLSAIPIESQTPCNARQLPTVADAAQSLMMKMTDAPRQPNLLVDHTLIPTPNGDLVARVYIPASGDGPFPVLVYFHGGGWVIANLNTYDASCRALVNLAECVVVSVAYRQAPENPFPAAADDAYYAFQHVATNPDAFHGEAGRIAIGGESAGGNLATVTCLITKAQGGVMPIHQLLIYPVTTFVPDGEGAASIEQFGAQAPLTAPLLTWFGDQYAPDPATRQNPNASPLLAPDLSGLPPATVIAAELDVLVGQGTQYADALTAAGVDTMHQVYTGVTHEFFGLGALVDQAAVAENDAADRLKDAFSAAPVSATPTPQFPV